MQNAIETTVSAARSAEAGLVAAVHRAADALDEVGRDPLALALGRLAESAAGAQARLQAGRVAAADLLLGALAAFGGFEAEVGESAPAAALPAPVAPEPTPEPEVSGPAPEPEEEEEAPEVQEAKPAPAPAKKAATSGRKPEPAGKGRARDRPGRVR
jgi:hypothetical protein